MVICMDGATERNRRMISKQALIFLPCRQCLSLQTTVKFIIAMVCIPSSNKNSISRYFSHHTSKFNKKGNRKINNKL